MGNGYPSDLEQASSSGDDEIWRVHRLSSPDALSTLAHTGISDRIGRGDVLMSKVIPKYHSSKIIDCYHVGDFQPLDQVFIGSRDDPVRYTRQEIKDGIMAYISEDKISNSNGKEHFMVRTRCHKCSGRGTYGRGRCWSCAGHGNRSITLTSAKSKITRSTPEAKAAKVAKKAAEKAAREAEWARQAQDRINGNEDVLGLQKATKEDWFPSDKISFAHDLIQKFGRWGNLSPKQMACVRSMSNEPEPVVKDDRILALSDLVEFLEPRDSSFATSLIQQSNIRNLSEKQMAWVIKLTKKGEKGKEQKFQKLRDKYLNF